jgi:hypothetical protein
MMVSKEWLDRYCERNLERPWGYWQPSVNRLLADRIRGFLRLGLERLNALPPDDSFWVKTNREPTLYKLGDYFGPKVQSEPGNDEARWIIASLLLHHGRDNELGWVLEPFLRKDFANIEWIMAAGLWCRSIGGFSHTSTMRDLLMDLRTRLTELRPRLNELRPRATPHLLSMIEEASRLDSEEWAAALQPPQAT